MRATLVKKKGQWYARINKNNIPVIHYVPDWGEGLVGDFEIVEKEGQSHAVCKTIDKYSLLKLVHPSKWPELSNLPDIWGQHK